MLKEVLLALTLPYARNVIFDSKNRTPGEVHRLLEAYHESEVSLCDSEIDELLSIANQDEREIDYDLLTLRYGKQQWIYEGTPYVFIRHFLHAVQPNEDDVIYDLGCGYGRLVLYGAEVTAAEYRGVEAVPERLLVAELARIRLGLPNAHFIRGDVRDQDYRDGTIFFLFNPFTDEVLDQIIDELRLIGITKPIKVITWGGPINHRFAKQSWLHEIDLPDNPSVNRVYGLRLFDSAHPVL